MIPCLYDKTATDFSSLGKGMLRSVTRAVVMEEVNGVFELELDIPKSDPLYNEIGEGSIITAIPSPYRGAEPFRVYKVTKAIAGVSTVYARHISYDLAAIPVNPFSASTAAAAMTGLSDHAVTPCPFTFLTNKTTSAAFSLTVPQAIRSTLGGTEGSILDVFRGEYVFEGYTVTLKQNRGSNRGFQVRYRKNLVGLSLEEDYSGVVDGILPFWTSEDEGTVYGTVQWKTGKSSGRVITHDYSDAYENKPTAATLNARASLLVNSSGYGEPDLSIEVDFVNLEQMSGGESLTQLERCDLGDTVTVIAEPLELTKAAEVVAIETNVLLEKYNKCTIGTVRADIAQTIVANKKDAESGIKATKNFLIEALDQATALITGATGGNIKYLYNDATGLPSAIVAMDTDDVATAQNVLILNYQGFGLSTNGINGPYSYALTAATGLNASLINVGVLQGIRAILESGSVGGWEIGTDSIHREYTDVDESGNSHTYMLRIGVPGSNNSWVLRSTATEGSSTLLNFFISAGGEAYFKRLLGLVVGSSSDPQNSLLHGNLVVDGITYLYNQVVVGKATDTKTVWHYGTEVKQGNMELYGTLFLGQVVNGTRTAYGRIYTPTDHELYLRVGSDVNRSVKLSQTNGHWGLHPYADTYLDLGLSGNRWDNVYAQNGTIQTSDRKAKKGIKDLPKKALDFIKGLKPKSFQMRKGTSGRRHWGFIAQEGEECMEAAGITSEDFAGLIKDEEGRYGLRYEEFIAPLTMAVQELIKRVDKLEGKDNGTS